MHWNEQPEYLALVVKHHQSFPPLDIYQALQPTGIRFPCVEHLFQFSLSQLWTLLSLPWHAGCVPGVFCTGLESCRIPLARSGSLCTPSTRLPACPGGFGWWPARRLIPLYRCHLGWSPVQHTKRNTKNIFTLEIHLNVIKTNYKHSFLPLLWLVILNHAVLAHTTFTPSWCNK